MKDSFPEYLQDLNLEALNYFKMLKNKKYINFSNWKIFHKLYKDESVKFYIENFCIMNLPILMIPIFNLRHFILKLLHKR